MVGLVRSLGPQLADKGVTINAVCPSIVDTPLIDDMRELLESSGFPLIDVESVSTAVVDLLTGDATLTAELRALLHKLALREKKCLFVVRAQDKA